MIQDVMQRQIKKKISIIIPALNEAQGISFTINSIPRNKLSQMGYETRILVVDNDSNDGTADIAKKAGAEVIHEPKRGYGYAYKAGFARVDGDIIATVDADATYPIDCIPTLVEILEKERLDFLTTNRFGSLKNGNMSLRNRTGNTILSICVKLLFRLNMRDPESGMWVFRKHILDNLKLRSNTWPFSHELKLEACYFNKFRWQEVPIEYRIRIGRTKLLSAWRVGLTDLFHIIGKRISR
jgi:glycosyltransferase involved in cell wall biosynthesis